MSCSLDVPADPVDAPAPLLRRPSRSPRGARPPGPATSNGLTVSAKAPSSSCAPVFSERTSTPSRSFTSGASFATRFRPSKIAFTSRTSYCLYAAIEARKLSAIRRSSGCQPSCWKRSLTARADALDRARGTPRTRGCPGGTGRGAPASGRAGGAPDARRGRARRRGSRGRRSSTGRSGRRGGSGTRAALPRALPRPRARARSSRARRTRDGSTEIGEERTAGAPPVEARLARGEVDRRPRSGRRTSGGSSRASGRCGSATRSLASRPSCTARRIGSGSTRQ